jgi:hypothetical protein
LGGDGGPTPDGLGRGLKRFDRPSWASGNLHPRMDGSPQSGRSFPAYTHSRSVASLSSFPFCFFLLRLSQSFFVVANQFIRWIVHMQFCIRRCRFHSCHFYALVRMTLGSDDNFVCCPSQLVSVAFWAAGEPMLWPQPGNVTHHPLWLQAKQAETY